MIAKIQEDLIEHKFYKENIEKKTVEKLQKGAFRVNCLDSLDRTNVG